MSDNKDIRDDIDPCPDVDVLKDFAFGRIRDVSDRSLVQAHLEFCGSCRLLLNGIKGTRANEAREQAEVCLELEAEEELCISLDEEPAELSPPRPVATPSRLPHHITRESQSLGSGERSRTGARSEFCDRESDARIRPEVASHTREESNATCVAQLKTRQEKFRKDQKRDPAPGTIWRSIPESDAEVYGPLVLVLKGPDSSVRGHVRVAEVSEDVSQAIETDMILEPKSSGLPFECMVRSENTFWTEPSNLIAFAGKLPPDSMVTILDFISTADRYDSGVPLKDYKFGQNEQGTKVMQRRGVTSGLPASRYDDPRLATLDLARRRCSYLVSDVDETEPRQTKTVPHRQPATSSTKWLLPLAAMLAAVVVTSGTMHVLHRAQFHRMKAEYEKYEKSVNDWQQKYAAWDDERSKKMAESEEGLRAAQSRLADLEKRDTDLKSKLAMLESAANEKGVRLAQAQQEVKRLSQQVTELAESFDNQKQGNAKAVALRREAERRLAAAFRIEEDSRPRFRFEMAESRQLNRAMREELRADALPATDHRTPRIPGASAGDRFIRAVKAGDLTEVKAMLKQDPNLLRFVDPGQRFDPLLWAVYEGHTPIVSYLLEQGAEVNVTDILGETPLMIAASLGDQSIVEMLLRKGGDSSIRNREGKTALDLASVNGHSRVVKILKEKQSHR